MAETSRAATLLAPNKLEIREYPIPDIPDDGGLLKVEMGGVCGSDVKYYHGRINLPLPIILGHEILGRVAKLGSKAEKIHGVKEGDRVIMKGAIGCGRCSDCRRNAQRFCRNRTNYGGGPHSAQPPHPFTGPPSASPAPAPSTAGARLRPPRRTCSAASRTTSTWPPTC